MVFLLLNCMLGYALPCFEACWIFVLIFVSLVAAFRALFLMITKGLAKVAENQRIDSEESFGFMYLSCHHLASTLSP